MRVKVCGITNLEDGLICYQNGAQALGFIFAALSPRCIQTQECKKIISLLPPFCERIGVFVDEKPETIAQIAQECGLSTIQLHGKTENSEYICKLKQLINLPIIKAFRMAEAADCSLLKDLPYENLQAILIDGPGKTIVNSTIFAKAKSLSKLPLILAGALSPENIVETLQKLKPQAIDLCSALEKEPRKKDPEKVKKFFEKINT